MGDGFNPYQAPRVDEPPIVVALAGRVAVSRGVRFANLFIDSACRVVIWLTLAYLAHDGEKARVAPMALSALMLVGYYLLFEGLFQLTPGKLVTRTRVVDLDGNKPTFFQIFVRSLARFVPLEPLSFLGRTKEGWHDRWSDTRVVRR